MTVMRNKRLYFLYILCSKEKLNETEKEIMVLLLAHVVVVAAAATVAAAAVGVAVVAILVWDFTCQRCGPCQNKFRVFFGGQ